MRSSRAPIHVSFDVWPSLSPNEDHDVARLPSNANDAGNVESKIDDACSVPSRAMLTAGRAAVVVASRVVVVVVVADATVVAGGAVVPGTSIFVPAGCCTGCAVVTSVRVNVFTASSAGATETTFSGTKSTHC